MGFYHSTRSASPTFTSKEAIRRGIAPDGGLFVSDDLGGTTIDISTLANKDYPTLARIFEHCMAQEAFQRAAPAAQPDAA